VKKKWLLSEAWAFFHGTASTMVVPGPAKIKLKFCKISKFKAGVT
jgi:hypothetical protein